jgi:hypothetical protein
LIKIRYLDLPTGLHVRAEAQGTDTIVYLLPGLTTAQRRAALHGARSGARMGRGPDLPVTGLACAVAADRVRTTLRNGAAAMRVHPGIVIPPMLLMVSAALAYLLLASVSLTVTYRPQGAGPGPQGNPVLQGIAPPGASPAHPGLPRRGARGHATGTHPRGSVPSQASPPLPSGSPSPSGYRTPSPSPSAGQPSPGQPSPEPSPGQPSPGPSPSVGPSGSPSPSSPPSPSPSPSGAGGTTGGGGTGGCVTIGPWGICAHL